MKKFLMCLFIGLFILTGEALAVCACCGAETTVTGSGYYRYRVCTGSCGSDCESIDMCSTCGKCSTHCTCADGSGGSGSGSGSGSPGHICSFVNKCSKKQCDLYI